MSVKESLLNEIMAIEDPRTLLDKVLRLSKEDVLDLVASDDFVQKVAVCSRANKALADELRTVLHNEESF